jgi:hypothetical protein
MGHMDEHFKKSTLVDQFQQRINSHGMVNYRRIQQKCCPKQVSVVHYYCTYLLHPSFLAVTRARSTAVSQGEPRTMNIQYVLYCDTTVRYYCTKQKKSIRTNELYHVLDSNLITICTAINTFQSIQYIPSSSDGGAAIHPAGHFLLPLTLYPRRTRTLSLCAAGRQGVGPGPNQETCSLAAATCYCRRICCGSGQRQQVSLSAGWACLY